MARKELTIQITDEGRDKGKVFLIREMAASQAERWAMRAFLAMGRAGIDLPDGIEAAGFAGLAKNILQTICRLPLEDAEALLAEMFTCVLIQPNPKDPNVSRPLIEDDIEEVSTRFKLRVEIFRLHVGFFTGAA